MNPSGFAGIPNGQGGGAQRRQTFVLLKSDPAFLIPAWAQGGKGLVYVTGCGGGASGGVNASNLNQTGGGGGGGGSCLDYPVHLPASDTTLSIIVGAGGAAITDTTFANGLTGGASVITTSAVILTMGGGRAGGNGQTTNAAGGAVAVSGIGPGNQGGSDPPPPTSPRVVPGAPGGTGDNTGAGNRGYGAPHLFGRHGNGQNSVSARVDGNNAAGFGAGGSGANTYATGLSTTSGAGAPGFVMLEFVEGV